MFDNNTSFCFIQSVTPYLQAALTIPRLPH